MNYRSLLSTYYPSIYNERANEYYTDRSLTSLVIRKKNVMPFIDFYFTHTLKSIPYHVWMVLSSYKGTIFTVPQKFDQIWSQMNCLIELACVVTNLAAHSHFSRSEQVKKIRATSFLSLHAILRQLHFYFWMNTNVYRLDLLKKLPDSNCWLISSLVD